MGASLPSQVQQPSHLIMLSDNHADQVELCQISPQTSHLVLPGLSSKFQWMNNHLFVCVWRPPITFCPNTINEILHLCQQNSTLHHCFFPVTPLLGPNKRRIGSGQSGSQASNPFGEIGNPLLPHLHQFPLTV